MERYLSVTINLEKDKYGITVFEPDSGYGVKYGPYNMSNKDSLSMSTTLGKEIISWVEIMKENYKEEI